MSNTDDSSKTLKNPWNQLFIQHDDNDDGSKHEDYKISSSLKTIWTDASDARQNSSNYSAVSKNCPDQRSYARPCSPTTECVQFGNNVLSIKNFNAPKPVRPIGPAWDKSAVGNNTHSNHAFRGRPITSRNGGYSNNFGNENQPNYYPMAGSSASYPSTAEPTRSASVSSSSSLQTAMFLQQVKIIVSNGFLDPRILNEDITADTFDLIQMLIYYVMEYKEAKQYAISDNSPAMEEEIKQIFQKINVIQNEISRSQLQHLEQMEKRQKLLQSYSAVQNLLYKQPINHIDHTAPNQFRPANSSSGQFFRNNDPNWRNARNRESENQRFNQRQCEPHSIPVRPTYASVSRSFAFLAKAKNTDKRSPLLNEHVYSFSQK